MFWIENLENFRVGGFAASPQLYPVGPDWFPVTTGVFRNSVKYFTILEPTFKESAFFSKSARFYL
jgi:hypothetical protein